MTEKNYKNYQIYRVDGRGVFLEVLNSAFNIKKVQINFIQYDIKTNKQILKIMFYLDIDDALLLCNDILSGRLVALAKKAIEEKNKGGYKYAKEIYLKQGGVHAQTLAKRGESRPDGKALGREFKITPGEKLPWILSAEQGPGKEIENGLIKMEKTEQIIRVPMDNDTLKKFAIILQTHINAYINQLYTNGTEFGHAVKRDELVSNISQLIDNPEIQKLIANSVAKGIAEFNKNKK